MSDLSKAQLKQACEQMGLSTSGGKDELVDRIMEAAEKAKSAGEGAAIEEEEEDEEQEPVAPVQSASKAKGKAKASPATGPTKTISKARRPAKA